MSRNRKNKIKGPKIIPVNSLVILRRKVRAGIIDFDMGTQGCVIDSPKYDSMDWPRYSVRVTLAPHVYVDLFLPHELLGKFETDPATGLTRLVGWE